jgi:hypothetical protein
MARNKTYIYTRRRIRRKGKLDGRNWRWKIWLLQKDTKSPLPLVDQEEAPPYERELLRLGDQKLDEISNSWKHADEILKSEYCLAKKKLQQTRERLDKEEKEVGPARDAYDAARNQFMELNRPEISKRAEWVFLLLFMILEFPLNAVVFSVLGASKVETYIAAGGICVILPLAAAYFGNLLRRENKTPIQKIFIALIPLIVILVFTGVAIMRAELFGVEQKHSILKIELSAEAASVIFISFNLIIFTIATIISYLASHTRPEHFNNLQEKYHFAKKRYEKEHAEAVAAAHDVEQAQLDFELKRQRRQKKHEQFKTWAETTIENVEFSISVYRTANLEVRYDGKTPKCFEKPVDMLELPDSLRDVSLDWDCEQYISNVPGSSG